MINSFVDSLREKGGEEKFRVVGMFCSDLSKFGEANDRVLCVIGDNELFCKFP